MIIGHDTFFSKATRAISVDCPREIWRVNELTDSKLFLLQFSTIINHDKQGKGKEQKKKRLSICLSNKGRYEVSDVELLIVQSLKELLDVGNATSP